MTHTANTTLNGEKLKAFTLRSGTRLLPEDMQMVDT